MRNAFLFLTAAVLALALGTAIPAAATVSAAAPQGVGDDPQAPPPPPQAVSPADPKAAPPGAGSWTCPYCGEECAGPVWRHKGQLGRPQLGPGREWGRESRPGRWGRDGERRGRGATDVRSYSRMGARPYLHGFGRADFPGPGARGGLAADMVLRRAEELKLTDGQIKSLETLAYENRKKLVDLHARIQKSEIEIQTLLRSESDDLAQIKRHLDAASSARAEIQEARIKMLFDVRKVLTSDQKKALKEEFPRMGRIID